MNQKWSKMGYFEAYGLYEKVREKSKNRFILALKTPKTARKYPNYSQQLMALNVFYAARFIRHYPDGRNLNLKGFNI